MAGTNLEVLHETPPTPSIARNVVNATILMIGHRVEPRFASRKRARSSNCATIEIAGSENEKKEARKSFLKVCARV